MTDKRLIEIISTMLEYKMLDPNRLYDSNYVIERIKIFLEAKEFVDTHFKDCF